MSSSNHIVYTPRPDTSAELEAAALADVYRYILRCYEEKEAAEAVEASEYEKEGGDGYDLLISAEVAKRPGSIGPWTTRFQNRLPTGAKVVGSGLGNSNQRAGPSRR